MLKSARGQRGGFRSLLFYEINNCNKPSRIVKDIFSKIISKAILKLLLEPAWLTELELSMTSAGFLLALLVLPYVFVVVFIYCPPVKGDALFRCSPHPLFPTLLRFSFCCLKIPLSVLTFRGIKNNSAFLFLSTRLTKELQNCQNCRKGVKMEPYFVYSKLFATFNWSF